MYDDVLIIGAGCTGVMTARLLSTKQCKVAVVEAGSFDLVCAGACAPHKVLRENKIHNSISFQYVLGFAYLKYTINFRLVNGKKRKRM